MELHIVCIPGDGIGPEIIREAKKILEKTADVYGHKILFQDILMGGASIDVHGVPLTEEAVADAKAAYESAKLETQRLKKAVERKKLAMESADEERLAMQDAYGRAVLALHGAEQEEAKAKAAYDSIKAEADKVLVPVEEREAAKLAYEAAQEAMVTAQAEYDEKKAAYEDAVNKLEIIKEASIPEETVTQTSANTPETGAYDSVVPYAMVFTGTIVAIGAVIFRSSLKKEEE